MANHERTLDPSRTEPDGLEQTDPSPGADARGAQAAGVGTECADRRDLRLGAIERLASGLFHEINNQLTVASVNANLLELDARDDETRSIAHAISDGAAQAAELTTAFLRLARHDARTTGEPFDLRDAVEDAGRLIRTALPSGVTLAVELLPDPVWVDVDRRALLEVLLVLALATGDVADRGTRLTLALANVTSARETWSNASPTGSRRAMLTLDDDGPGELDLVTMPSFQRYARERFGPTSTRAHATIEALVTAANGRIDVVPRPGPGGCVEIAIPLAATETCPVLEELP